jgi:hypothetical protein
VLDSSATQDETAGYRPNRNVRWTNTELGQVVMDGEVIGSVRRRLDGDWDAVVGRPSRGWKAAARRVVDVYRQRQDDVA